MFPNNNKQGLQSRSVTSCGFVEKNSKFFPLCHLFMHMIVLTSVYAYDEPGVLTVMRLVADWQLANPSNRNRTDWTQATGYMGIMALAKISGDVKYTDAMMAMGIATDWKLGPRITHADDQAVGQTYCELFFLYHDPAMIAPMQANFDSILANPPNQTNLTFVREGNGGQWSWADSLFMAPPTYVRLSNATGNMTYQDYAVNTWWITSELLYDRDEHLFYRDTRYLTMREANGEKVFWGRGNGWVMAGLVRMLQYLLPMNHPDSPRFEQQFQEMAAKVLTCQQNDGLWRSSLLDPDNYPLKETSGSGLFTYALAWGVNQGLLNKTATEPAVRKAWAALVGCVQLDGKLIHVQPIGADPKTFLWNSTGVFGVGAFLLAGSEVHQMLQNELKSVLIVMQRVADWQLNNPSSHNRTDWTQAVGYTGIMALASISGDAKYLNAMLAMGNATGWKLGPNMIHPDDMLIGQTYCELFFLYNVPAMIAPMQADFDNILTNPPNQTNLTFTNGDRKGKWSWPSPLFLAAPTYMLLSNATGSMKYQMYANITWWITSDWLYDKDECLFYHDTRFLTLRETNGEKVFWSRANGWVMAGLVRVLRYLRPMNHPDSPRFEQQFKEMSAKILMHQQPDGLWRTNLLDPNSYPAKETSGSGLFTYALAWGVNQGLLNKTATEPAVRKAWAALVGCVQWDGKLIHVQPAYTGSTITKNFFWNSTEVYGVGAFLLAGSEIYQMLKNECSDRYVPGSSGTLFLV